MGNMRETSKGYRPSWTITFGRQVFETGWLTGWVAKFSKAQERISSI